MSSCSLICHCLPHSWQFDIFFFFDHRLVKENNQADIYLMRDFNYSFHQYLPLSSRHPKRWTPLWTACQTLIFSAGVAAILSGANLMYMGRCVMVSRSFNPMMRVCRISWKSGHQKNLIGVFTKTVPAKRSFSVLNPCKRKTHPNINHVMLFLNW